MITISKKSLKVGKYVDNAHVDSVIKTYKQEKWIHNSERIGKEDSLSAWYSVEELEEFLQNSKQHGADGIRLYFGAYPKNYEEIPEYAGRQTIVLVATKSKETENGIVNKNIYVTNDETPNLLAYNMASLCPPFCKGGIGYSNFPEIGLTVIDKGNDGMIVV